MHCPFCNREIIKTNIKLHKYFNGHTDKRYKIMLIITSVEMAVSKKKKRKRQTKVDKSKG